MRNLSAGMLVVLLVACSEPAALDHTLDFVTSEAAMTVVDGDTVIFSPGHMGEVEDRENLLPILVSGGDDRVQIRGSFLAGCGGPVPSATSSFDGNTLMLSISFPPDGNHTCAAVLQAWTYTAYFSDIAEGSYGVIVRHNGDLLREEAVVAETRAQVN